MGVTTVIPTIGRDTLWTRAIPSVMAQDADWRCIVVADGVDIAPFDDPRITVLRMDAPEYPDDHFERWRILGVRAFAHGLDHVETEWFSYLADDDEYLPSHHTALLRVADEADVVCGQWHYRIDDRTLAHSMVGCPPGPMEVMQGAYIARTSLGIRPRDSGLAVDGAGWDADWWHRLRLMDIRWKVVPEEVAAYWPDINGFGYR